LQIARSRIDLEEDLITYTDSLDAICETSLEGFFVGWPNPPSAQTHLKILESSDFIVLALDEDSGPVVGFVNAISDRVLTAYIPFLEVLPAYQGRGIGTELVQRIISRLSGFYMVDLICDTTLQPFYERLGLTRATGMMRRNLERQSGE
jgi:ribosomal protein S18 acetylase RimI-like enzyme